MNVGEERTASHSPKDESKWDHYSQLSPEELYCARSKYPNIQPAGRRLLEYGAEKEGYWTSAHFMEQVMQQILRM